MASQDCIARARSVRIEEEIAARGHRLRRSGGELIGPCPACGGVDRFGINIRKQLWNCRNCGNGGDVIALVRHLDGCGFADAVELLTGEKSTDLDHAAVRPDLVRQVNAKAEAAESWPRRTICSG